MMKRRPAVWVLAVLLALPAIATLACSSGGPAAGTTSGTSAVGGVTATTAVSAGTPTTAGTTSTAASVTTTVDQTAGGGTPLAVFATIGDYGVDDSHEAAVAKLVASWDPSYVITLGDDYYSVAGGTGTGRYDESTGAYYGRWLKNITTTGKRQPVGLAAANAFFPCLGNHDYSDATPSPSTYLTYFDLPGSGFSSSSGNERYYDFVEGPIHFFALDSNQQEPDGTSSTSKQALWLKAQLATSASTWNIVFDHHPPYSSDLVHGSSQNMEWPFAAWGADAVLSGHAHVYERVERDGMVYFVNGLGGAGRYLFGPAVGGSKVRFRADWGAQKVTVTSDSLTFEFWSVGGRLIDSYRLKASAGSA
jgi:tartrate-resistant acid phosphatase type 5